MMTAVAMVGLLAMVGAAIDYTTASSSKSRSQNIADAVALNAAAFVRANKGKMPTDRKNGLPTGDYTAAELGYDVKGWVAGGAEDVIVNVAYDMTAKEAIVTVSGETNASFSAVMGIDTVGYSSRSVVGMEDLELNDVASLALILDNSGSMAWDDRPYKANGFGWLVPPTGAVARITALEDSVKGFMTYLEPLVGTQTGTDPKVFRSGMLAYNGNTINSRTKPMGWRLLSDGTIDAMTAQGSTRPANALATAADWLVSEPAVHKAASGKTPLRYAVFMTDGVNDGNDPVWIDQTGTGKWRRQRCSRPDRWSRWSCWYSYRTSSARPSGNARQWNGGRQRRGNWSEGRDSYPQNETALASCKRMKDDGVTVYTIGFALEPGTYGMNDFYWDYNAGRYVENTRTLDASIKSQAFNFLAACASNADTFIKAANADELTAAFNTIGEDILSDTIRIKR
ncbi:pilus assembly protein TadG-related protein [uncultured Algimonas sp.]|uniref:pilus assembly protein TadG-related protein n=1 Tax=uncultured Algimonas sp. TaxID=1547920 RepID=UPI002627B1D7|nr:pilus assembly protein TadG-related protein [uncultured Algimonas sp.]